MRSGMSYTLSEDADYLLMGYSHWTVLCCLRILTDFRPSVFASSLIFAYVGIYGSRNLHISLLHDLLGRKQAFYDVGIHQLSFDAAVFSAAFPANFFIRIWLVGWADSTVIRVHQLMSNCTHNVRRGR